MSETSEYREGRVRMNGGLAYGSATRGGASRCAAGHAGLGVVSRRGFVAGMALSALALAGCGNGALSQAASTGSGEAATSGGTLHIGFPSSGQNFSSGPLGVAQVKGYLDEELASFGYTAEVTGFVGAAPALHEALVSGDLDLVNYAGFAGILGKSKGIDTTHVAVTGWGSGWHLVAASSIGSIAELKGKKVAYTRGATPQMYLIKVLAEAGLSFDDIEAVNSTIPDGLSSLSTGAVDAVVCTGGLENSLVESGVATTLHVGMDADESTYYEPMDLVGRTGFVESNGDVVVAVIKALLRAKDDIVADPEAFVQLCVENSGNSEDVVRASLQEDVAAAFPISLDDVYIDSLKSIQAFELENDLIESEIDIDAWTDDSYLNQALDEYAGA